MSTINVLWAIDHVCYDGRLHGGGRLYWNLLPLLSSSAVRVVPVMLRASDTIRELFDTSPVPVRILDKAKFDPTTLTTFLHLIRAENIHVMHLHCYACSTFGRFAGLITDVPCVIHDYDTEVYFPYPSYLGLADRMLASSTACGLAASPMVKKFMKERRRLPSDKIRMMFHAVPNEKFDRVPDSRIQDVRRQFGLQANNNLVCTVTKLGADRGNELLLDAAQRVIAKLPDTQFALIYKPTHFHRQPDKRYVPADHEASVEKLREKAQSIGLESNLLLIEETSEIDVDALMAASDVFVAPFLSERFSSVHLLESMALGTPVVASDVGEPRAIIRNGVDGFLVPPGDKDHLAATLCEVLGGNDRLVEISGASRDSAYTHSAEAYARVLQDLYTSLATERLTERANRKVA